MQKTETRLNFTFIIDSLILSILLLLLFFTPLIRGIENKSSVWIVHASVLIMLFLWLLEIIRHPVVSSLPKNIKASFKRTDLDLPILLFIILSIISAAFSVSPARSFFCLLLFFDYIAIYYITVNKINDPTSAKMLIYTIIASGTLVAVLGITKYLGTNVRILGSTYINPNPLASFFIMAIPLAIAMMALTRDTGKKLLSGYCICMMAVALILTLSRGGWFSSLCALFLMAYLYKKKSNGFHGKISIPVLIILAAVLLSIVFLGFVNVRQEIAGLMQKKRIESFSGRVPIWKGTLEIIRDHPLLGSGPGTFPLMYHDYIKKHSAGLNDLYAHSEYLQAVSEWGIFSILIIICIQTLFFYKYSGHIPILIRNFQNI